MLAQLYTGPSCLPSYAMSTIFFSETHPQDFNKTIIKKFPTRLIKQSYYKVKKCMTS